MNKLERACLNVLCVCFTVFMVAMTIGMCVSMYKDLAT